MALQFGTSTSLTITAGSLASNAARSSAVATVDTTKAISDILLTVNVDTTTTASSGNKQVVVYGYCSEDGTTYNGSTGTTDNVDGTDKSIGLGSPTNLVIIGRIALNTTTSGAAVKKVFSVVSAFGFIPVKWGIVLHNDAGTALGSPVTATYTEQYYT